MAKQYTLQEIAEDLGLSRERVRTIERQALAKVKANLLRQGFEPDDCINLREDRFI